MNVDISSALPEFIAESRMLLQDLEASLLRLENDGASADADTVNAMFRAAHTIKGSAGVFGLEPIVKFTHVMENVLDKLRENTISIAGDLVNTLLVCCDHLNGLIDALEKHEELSNAALDARALELTTRLRVYLGEAPPGKGTLPVEQTVTVESSGGSGSEEHDYWHLSLRFGRDTLRNGMDPLSFIRYLGTLGEIAQMTTLLDELPAAVDMDAESCYLGFEIDLRSAADKQTIESAFEFVRDDITLRILPPPSHLARYLERIKNLNGDIDRLGDILRESGILTNNELDDALKFQETAPNPATGKSPLGEILVSQGMVQQPVVSAALDKQKQLREHKAQEARFVRVHADKLDALINLVGELVISSASTALLAQKAGDARLHESTHVMSRLVEEIRDGALHLRMVEIGDTFNRFTRVVRDVSKELGKNIELLISGADTELDKTVVEKIGDPLMHLVRNAMDHGIESAATRAACGKPAKGTLRLNAHHDSGSIVIEVSDDGGGLPRDKILRKAVERGLVAEGQSLTDQEICNLIFEPGFSTADAVTNLSGRGVGMDVVRRNIQALRGTVEIHGEEGRGTTVRIRLPLTLAIIDGFLVGVATSCYVVPLDMVVECLELSPQHLQETGDHNYVNLRGEVLPFIRLREQFALTGETRRRASIVVVQHAGHKAGLVVDELLGEFQTVIKPLANLFNRVKGVSGSTILGTGEVALILDVPALIQQAAAAHGKDARRQRVA